MRKKHPMTSGLWSLTGSLSAYILMARTFASSLPVRSYCCLNVEVAQITPLPEIPHPTLTVLCMLGLNNNSQKIV